MLRSLFITAALLAMFGLSTVFMEPDPISTLLRAAIVIACVIGLLRWGGGGLYAFSKGVPRESSKGVLGLSLVLLAEGMQGVYTITYLSLERPEWMSDLFISPFLAGLKLVGLFFLINATRFGDEEPMKIGGAVAALIAFFGTIIALGGPFIISKISVIAHVIASLFGRVV